MPENPDRCDIKPSAEGFFVLEKHNFNKPYNIFREVRKHGFDT